MRAKELVAIEMNHVGRVRCTPGFCLPGQISQELSHDGSVGEAGNVNESGSRACEERTQLTVTLRVDGPVTRSCLHEE